MFPLLNLPLLPLEIIMRRMDPFELINFSMLSNRCTTAAERAKRKVDEVEWYFNDLERIIKVKTPNCWHPTTIEFHANPRNPRITMFDVKHGCEKYSDIWIVSKSVNMLDTLEKLSAHILKIFKAKELNLKVENVHPSLPNFWDGLNLNFHSVYFSSMNGTIDANSRSMMFILENIKTDQLTLWFRQFSRTFQYSKPLKHKTLCIQCGRWITLDNLLNMECEDLTIVRSHITTEELYVFFDKWKEGGFPKLKKLFLAYPIGYRWDLIINDTDEDGNPILTDVNGNRGTFEHYNNIYIEFRVNFQT